MVAPERAAFLLDGVSGDFVEPFPNLFRDSGALDCTEVDVGAAVPGFHIFIHVMIFFLRITGCDGGQPTLDLRRTDGRA